ncbi:hypothetical protein TrVE_jg9166 [Triparma verrucosa]|uniref:G-protein coupled receptors family 2 profile 2 domain-containing protein n=1 Tax=Triparma verrucosa TaxID=1606542 RepID=A0A9W7C3L5_9STRA|nr:hypothetical protein TrVE_jg9166 [Triparma verrucosa]
MNPLHYLPQPIAHRLLKSDDSSATGFSPKENEILLIITVAESVLSLIGSILIVTSYLKFKRLRKFSLELVFWLSVSDIGMCVSYFFGNPKSGGLCTAQAMIMSFFELASVLWTTVIALTLFRLIILQRTSSHLIKYYHVFCFGVPFVSMFLPLLTNSYGDSGAWCWISTPTDESETDKQLMESPGNLWRLTLFYLPLWLAIIFNSTVYLIVTKTLSRVASTQASDQRPKYLKMIRRLRLYPLILVFCWLGATINRIQNVIDPSHPWYSLYLFQVATRSLQGTLNALVYGFNNHVIGEWLSIIPNGCSWSASKEEEESGGEEEDEEDGIFNKVSYVGGKVGGGGERDSNDMETSLI